MTAVEIMMAEHKNITRMLKVIRKMSMEVLKGKDINYEDFYQAIDFIRNYADNHHHKKEEVMLFNRMVENLGKVAQNSITHGMLVEHDLGRMYVRDLAEALDKVKNGDEEAKLDVIANAISYTNLLERHIDKEDRVIYKYAERELSEELQGNINEQCHQYEEENAATAEKYVALIEKFEEKYI